MNRIETKIIVMVTNALAGAKDSEAKTELIEELSNNLYQRYMDLTAAGVPEQEALDQAMDSLGDVQELLAYLGEEDELTLDQNFQWNKTSFEQEKSEQSDEQRGQNASHEKEWSQSFDADKLEKGIEDIVGMAMSAAKGAVELASGVTRNVTESLSKEFKQYEFHSNVQSSRRRGNGERWMIPSETIRSLDVNLYNGDIHLIPDPMAVSVSVDGDLDQLEYSLGDNGVLNIRQRSKNRGGSLFSRCIVADLEITIPMKPWERMGLQNFSGDVFVGAGLMCEALYLHTKSGDITLEGGSSGIVAQKMAVRTMSGDVNASGLAGSLYVNSTSGDVTVENCDLKTCGAISTSGDIYVECQVNELNCSSTSGDVELTFTDSTPASIKTATTSGDIRLELCGGEGFTLGYRTISGDISYDLDDLDQWAEQRESSKKGAILYRSGEPAKVQLSTVSGDIDMTLEA